MPNDSEDDVLSRAETRYKAALVPRSEPAKFAALIGNLVASAFASHATAPFPSQDRVIVVDMKTHDVVLTRGGSDVPANDLLSELEADLERLSIMQFRTKWDIAD
jgi:hypothetical protein